MAFDVNSAKKAGASEDQIIGYLTKTRHFDVAGALSAGASKQQIIEHLSTVKAPVFTPTVQQEPNVNQAQPEKTKSLLRNVGDFLTSSTQKFGNTLGTAASVVDSKLANVLPGVSGQTTTQIRQGTLDSRKEQADNLVKLARQTSDPAKKKSYLEAAKKSADTSGYDIFSNPEYQKTAKQVFGEGLGVLAEATTFSGLGSSAKAGVNAAKTTSQVINAGNKLKSGSKLAKAADLGYDALVNGGLQFGAAKAATALQENKSTSQILKSAATGTLQGAAMSAATTLLAKGATNLVNKIKDKKLSSALEAITPNVKDLSKNDKLALVKSGNLSQQGNLSKVKILNTKEDLRIADKFKEVLSKGSPQSKVNNLTSYIDEKDALVGNYLSKNNAIFNNAQLKKNILARINDNVIDPTLTDKVKNQMVDQLIARIPQNNLHGLWTGRKAFDQYFQKAFTGNPTLKNQLVREVRNAAQDFVEGKIVDSKYKLFMKDMSDAFKARDILAVKASKDIGQSKVSKVLKNNPALKTALKYTALGAATYAGGDRLVKAIRQQ